MNDTMQIGQWEEVHQELVNNLQHQKSIKAIANMRVVMSIRCGVSHPSLVGGDNCEVYATVGLVAGGFMTTGVGNCRLLQAVCVPVMGAGVEVAYPEPAGIWLGEDTVGLTNGPGSDNEGLKP